MTDPKESNDESITLPKPVGYSTEGHPLYSQPFTAPSEGAQPVPFTIELWTEIASRMLVGNESLNGLGVERVTATIRDNATLIAEHGNMLETVEAWRKRVEDGDTRLQAAEEENERLRGILQQNGYITDHAFRPDPDYPDDRGCTACDGVEEDHIAALSDQGETT